MPPDLARKAAQAGEFKCQTAPIGADHSLIATFQLNDTVDKPYSFQMGGPIGEGYTKAPNSNWMLTANVSAVYRNGQLHTTYPLLRPFTR
jgi:hypothetical protein